MKSKEKKANTDLAPDTAEKPKSKYRELNLPFKIITGILITITILLTVNWVFDLRFFVGYVMQSYTYYYLIVACLAPMVYLYIPAAKKNKRLRESKTLLAVDVIFAATIFVMNLYLAYNAYNINMFGWERQAPAFAMVSSIVLWVLYVEMARRCGGNIIAVFILLFSTLPIYTRYLPGILNGISRNPILTAQMHILGTDSGMGTLIRTFADTVLPYTIFGTVIVVCGGGEFFLNLALLVFGRFRGGTAKVSIVSSALFGSISGNPVVNVLTTGSVTIPAMKKTGFDDVTAGAVEACASTAGTMTPPIMGTASFVMASIVGVSYKTVALSALIPILLYYISIMIALDIYATKHHLKGLPKSEIPSIGESLSKGWFFIPTMAVLIFFIFGLNRISDAALYASLTAIICVQFDKRTRFTREKLSKMIKDTSTNSMEVIGVMLGVGFIMGSFSMTGIGISFPRAIYDLSGGNIPVLILLTALASLVMGMGMTTIACYIFLSVTIAPALQLAGLNVLCVHLFLLYCGMLSYITPPVAVATIPAAMLSGGDGTKIGLTACKLGATLFLVPFFFIGNPDIILQGDSVMSMVISIGTIAVAVVILTQALSGYIYGIGEINLSKWGNRGVKLMMLVAAFLLGIKTGIYNIIGVVIFAAVVVIIKMFGKKTGAVSGD